MVTIKQIPTDNSLTASTNVISMQYPNTILNTKMTLPQLDGPIDVVSPEHSSDDRSHEFQIASQKNASIEFLQSRICTLPPKQNPHTAPLQLVYPNMHKARSFPRSPAKNTGYFHIPCTICSRLLYAPIRLPLRLISTNPFSFHIRYWSVRVVKNDALPTEPRGHLFHFIFAKHIFFCGRRPLPFGGSHLRLPSGPAGIRTTTGSLSALARPRHTN